MTDKDDSTPLRNFTDSHFHSLAMRDRGIDPAATVRACRAAGMAEMIDIGLHPRDLDQRKELFSDSSGIFFSSGFSPAEAVDDRWKGEIHLLEAQAKAGTIAAIGELGLDWHWNYGSKEAQIALMTTQLEVAKASKLPIIIHNREADADIVDLLQQTDLPAAGVMHCFSSDYPTASKCIDLGYFISFAGNVTYKNSTALCEAAKKIPIGSLLLETDAPFLSPQAVRRRVNTPLHIVHTYEFVAALRGIAVGFLAEKVRENFQKMINSTRRLDAFPSSVSFGPTGSVPPRPS
jgi:TatD DNase family protein